MLLQRMFSGRYALLLAFISWFLAVSFLLRIVFLGWEANEVSRSLFDIVRTFLTGFFFDIGTASFMALPALVYFTVLPNRFAGSKFDKAFSSFFAVLTLFILVFTFFAEITFWDEFRTRFNFIAVDYLIYTHEVIANIRQSYPLPLLVLGVATLTFLVTYIFYRRRIFENTFTHKAGFKQRFVVFACIVSIALFFSFFVTNNQAEWSSNRYNSEISKSGIYSFFAAMRNNRMDYDEFYTTNSDADAFAMMRSKLSGQQVAFSSSGNSIHRNIGVANPSKQKKNVVFILTESLSAKFMNEFGNKENITPFLDSIAQKSLFFTNMYATGTRTVRGMEAVTLCVPPTPGQSIVKRPENKDLYTISNVFRSRDYACNFFYGGDGYFDNMNAYFGGNGFDIYDRGRGSVLSDNIKTTRHNIEDREVTFENAWGICDEDIFSKMLKVADEQYQKGRPFLNFVMTTSNHRPYTYPSGKIDIPSGTNRQGAVKYTDYAFRELFEKARKKPWFKNTVFVIIADHCASSAGKDEIDVANYHIPAFVINLPEQQNAKVGKLCSQIDLFPTLFSAMDWDYESDFYGKDVLSDTFEPRALFGTYRKLCLMKEDKVMVLSDGKKQNFYRWEKSNNNLQPLKMDRSFLSEAISYYQTADYLFTHKLLK
ncbi:sulfatase-like hydrolase/transferase [Flavobacterium sp. MAH-1]|uniref:Sulfatase-like hydrolase/transferase n=1 Tax=Flavobacterium agri TaxID=2743471 RepID=A0A7Y9C482_9FLAO|nr:alkaline phosphatase family protein [Flavobacterium agri]NUY79891.1 sulfatase-like hydrolase/transferase [Flavobacterium agri]NYA69916.1 sulfatase-like hydrolase/transferase [Flavobacterium agri]